MAVFGYVVLLFLSLLKEEIRQADRPQVFYAIPTVLDRRESGDDQPHNNRLTTPMSTKCNSRQLKMVGGGLQTAV